MDKYDEAIAYLTAHPGEIYDAWGFTSTHEAGCLFSYVRPVGNDSPVYGCLTMIRAGGSIAANDTLTKLIRADTRIPARSNDITLDTLPVFAEWQRLLDETIRKPPQAEATALPLPAPAAVEVQG